jgi:hypothetical protein
MKGKHLLRLTATLAVGLLSLAGFAPGRAAEAARGPFQYDVDLWREAEGLPQSRLRGVVQTRDGCRSGH